MTTQENPEKSTSERLNEILAQLSKDQLRFVVASMDYPNKKEAAEAVDIKSNTVYKWPAIVDEAVKLMALESSAAALAIRRRNLVKAMAVKAAGLDSADEQIRQKVATELIEWELGKAGSTVALTNPEGGPLIPPTDTNAIAERVASLLEKAQKRMNDGNV